MFGARDRRGHRKKSLQQLREKKVKHVKLEDLNKRPSQMTERKFEGREEKRDRDSCQTVDEEKVMGSKCAVLCCAVGCEICLNSHFCRRRNNERQSSVVLEKGDRIVMRNEKRVWHSVCWVSRNGCAAEASKL